MSEFGKVWRYPLERQHLVNNPIIHGGTDHDIQRRMFQEAAISTGIIAEYYACTFDTSDFYNDPNLEWALGATLPCIFDQQPTVKILKQFGWFTEDEERPTLLYLPMYKDWTVKELLDPRENSIVRIHYFGQNIPAAFRIVEKRLDSVYGIYWVCKLAPERVNDFYLIQDHGNHFLKRKQRISDVNDASSHVPVTGDNDEEDRTYEHDDYSSNILTANNTVDDYWDQIMSGNTENSTDFYNPNELSDFVTQTDKEHSVFPDDSYRRKNRWKNG